MPLADDDQIEGAPPGFVEPTFGQRLLGAVVDGALVAAVAFVVRAPVVVLALTAIYSITCTTLTGRTLGKRLLGTRVVHRTTGGRPSPANATIRWLLPAAGSLIAAFVVPDLDPLAPGWAFVVLLPILQPPLHRGLHDRAAGTVVTCG